MGEKRLYWEFLFKCDSESRSLGGPEILHFEEAPGPTNHREAAHHTGKEMLGSPFHGQFPRKIHLQCH